MDRRLQVMFFLLLMAAVAPVRAQGIRAGERITLTAKSDTILLGHDFVVPGSLRLQLDSAYLLQPVLDYSIDYRFGILTLTPFFRRLLSDSSARQLLAEYDYRPINLQREYYRRKLVTFTDTTGQRRLVAQERGGLTAASIFGKDFQRSGSVVRGFTIGSNRDLSLQSGFRLQFSGKITDDVEVLGALTDEQTPIQPEGNTQTLREVDNIFIEFRSPHVGSTIGKFTAANTISQFTAYSRKLQGVKAIGRYGDDGSTEVVAAVSPGKFRTQQMQGLERNQGPYRLTGPSGERTIIVVAGTEQVYVDGVAMTRGENNDYTIDYSTGEIFFQTRRPITSASRISVDFEYSDQQYSRSFLSLTSTKSLFSGGLTVTGSYLREADNPDATIDLTLTDQDKAILTAAGGDATRAVTSGVTFVGATDSLRNRTYRLDTVTVDGRVDTIYRYAPGDPRSLYNVVFSVAPDGRGDYQNVSFGDFEYVGKGLGNYLPVIYLPMPQMHQIGSLKLAARPWSGVELSGEMAYSDAMLNRFSTDPGARQGGLAVVANLLAQRDTLRLGGLNLGSINLVGSLSSLAAQFRPTDRIGDVEFNNRWNTSSNLGQSGYDELKAEGVLSYRPVSRLDLSVAPGYLRRRGIFESVRQFYALRFLGDTTLPSFQDTVEVITTRDTLLGGSSGNWLKHHGGVSYVLGPFVPGVRFAYERREDRAGTRLTDTLYPSSFSYIEAGPDLQVTLPFLTATAIARFRIDDSVRYDPGIQRGGFLRDGASQTYTLNGRLTGVRDLSSTLELTYRNKSYDSIPLSASAGRLDNNTLLVRSQTRWSGFGRGADADALYEVKTEQAARLQRIYIRVPFGTGQYVWNDIDSNGIAAPDEFRLTNAGNGEYNQIDYPTEKLYPVIDLRTSARLRLSPRYFLNEESWLGKALGPVTGETYLRVEEKSQTERESDIYLLRLSKFQNDSTTLVGNSIVQQDINLFDNRQDQEISFRLRYLAQSGFTQLVTAIERTNSIERSLRTLWHPTLDIGLQLDLASSNSLLHSTDSASTRTFDLTALSATNDFSYRPEQSLELGWKLTLSRSNDVLPAVPRIAYLNTNAVRAIYSIETRGRIRVELERTSVTGDNLQGNVLSLPYQLTGGYAVGTTWVGTVNVDYRFGANLQLSVNYSGRAQPPSNRVIHTGTAEIRAFF